MFLWQRTGSFVNVSLKSKEDFLPEVFDEMASHRLHLHLGEVEPNAGSMYKSINTTQALCTKTLKQHLVFTSMSDILFHTESMFYFVYFLDLKVKLI